MSVKYILFYMEIEDFDMYFFIYIFRSDPLSVQNYYDFCRTEHCSPQDIFYTTFNYTLYKIIPHGKVSSNLHQCACYILFIKYGIL